MSPVRPVRGLPLGLVQTLGERSSLSARVDKPRHCTVALLSAILQAPRTTPYVGGEGGVGTEGIVKIWTTRAQRLLLLHLPGARANSYFLLIDVGWHSLSLTTKSPN